MSNGGAKKRKHQEPENKDTKQAKLEESIQELTPRERQYLYSAGLHPVQLKKKKKKGDDDSNSAQDFATRALGSSSQTTRHEAIQRLQSYLSLISSKNGGGISYLDIQKLWKGMWYGLYMCDKTVVQEELSSHMAKLIWSVAGTVQDDIDEANHYVQFEQQALDDEEVAEEEDEEDVYDDEDDDDDDDDVELIDMDAWEAYQEEKEEQSEEASEEDEPSEEEEDKNDPQHSSVNLVCLFVKGYFETISREWGHMDKHRLDKFYRSMRIMMYQIFQYWASRDWHIGIIHMFNDVVFNPMLCEESTKFPNGVRFHLIDVVLKELVTVSSSCNTPIETESFFHILEPYLTIAMADPNKIVQGRVMENILERFLLQHSIFRTVSEDSNNSPIIMLDHVSVEYMAEQIFEIASNSETADRYRSSLYQLHKLYRRQIKENSNIPQAETTVGNDEEAITDQPVILDTAKATSTEIQRFDEQLSHVDDNNVHEEEQHEEKKKKKKKKKKKSTNKDVESEEQIELGIKEASKNVVNDEANRKETLKKSDQAPKHDTVLNSSSLCDIGGSLDTKDGSSGNSNKKKNKKINKNISNNIEGVMEKEKHPNLVQEDSEPPSADVPEPEVAKKKNKKKNKKQHSDDKIEFLDSSSKQLDDEIVISLRQQSDFLINAVNSINKSKKTAIPKPLVTNKQQKKADDAKERERQKRVKFGSVNRTKSYKASMTALQTMEHPATKTREPEKPILREPKYAPSPDVKRTVKEGNNRNAKSRSNKRLF